MAKQSKGILRRNGRVAWYYQLQKRGLHKEAAEWCLKHKLNKEMPGAKSVALQADSSEPSQLAVSTLSDSPDLARPAHATSLQAVSDGGAGVSLASLAQNLDQSAGRGQNPQSGLAGVGGVNVGARPSSTESASPSGEVEGNKQICQGDKADLFSNRLENGGWVVSGEGVVGGNCRNRWFVEVSVDGKWAKAAVGESVVRRGQRVRVRLEWVSADGRDAEYAIVGVLPDAEEPRQAAPVGFQHQNAREVPLEAVRQPESDPQSDPESDQPTPAEAATEGAEDYWERARKDAMKAFYGV